MRKRLLLPSAKGKRPSGNSLQALSFSAKDVLLAVDDFAPNGSTADVQRFHREADRFFRAQGNNSGRGRCRIDGSVRAAKPPRGLAISSGEDTPRGQSLRARLFVLELAPAELKWDRLTNCQNAAADGRYVAAMAGYIQHLARNYVVTRKGLKDEIAALREKAHRNGQHARTPGIVADLAVGLKYLFEFATSVGAITVEERDEIAKRCWSALVAAGAEQVAHVAAAEPTAHFLRLLADALASGRAHIAAMDGSEPPSPASWGWRRGKCDDWMEQGRRIGWLDGQDLYLAPEAAFAEAQELARQGNDSLPITQRTLWRRMRERGFLASCDQTRQRFTIRRTVESVSGREIVHILASTLNSRPSIPSISAKDDQIAHEKRTVAMDGCADSGDERPSQTSINNAETGQNGRK